LSRRANAAVLLGVVLWACQRERLAAPGAGVDEGGGGAVVVDTSFPVAHRGELVTRAVPLVGVGRWKPLALRCAEPPSLVLLAQGDSVDVLVLVDFGKAPPGPGQYAVRPEGYDAGSPGARVGMQRVQYSDVAYRAVRGTVDLERLDRYVTGRFDVLLREIEVGEEVRYLGAFDRVRVAPAPEAWCRRAAADAGPG